MTTGHSATRRLLGALLLAGTASPLAAAAAAPDAAPGPGLRGLAGAVADHACTAFTCEEMLGIEDPGCLVDDDSACALYCGRARVPLRECQASGGEGAACLSTAACASGKCFWLQCTAVAAATAATPAPSAATTAVATSAPTTFTAATGGDGGDGEDGGDGGDGGDERDGGDGGDDGDGRDDGDGGDDGDEATIATSTAAPSATSPASAAPTAAASAAATSAKAAPTSAPTAAPTAAPTSPKLALGTGCLHGTQCASGACGYSSWKCPLCCIPPASVAGLNAGEE